MIPVNFFLTKKIEWDDSGDNFRTLHITMMTFDEVMKSLEDSINSMRATSIKASIALATDFDHDHDNCGICFDDLKINLQTRCGHTFCIDCIRAWACVHNGKTCPTCRAELKYRNDGDEAAMCSECGIEGAILKSKCKHMFCIKCLKKLTTERKL